LEQKININIGAESGKWSRKYVGISESEYVDLPGTDKFRVFMDSILNKEIFTTLHF
jgi:hypothetical protein